MFTKRQEAELITSLQGRGEIPLKLNYLGEGAERWHSIAKKRKGSGINSVESQLLKKRVRDFLSSFPNKTKLNVIDMGCGDGSPVFPILDELIKQNIIFRYVPLDISQEMLDLAEKETTKRYPNCDVKKILLDFEMGNFSDITYNLKTENYSNLIVFFGSTLGNFSDRNRVLTNIRDSMGADDFLIVGVEMTNFSKISKLIPHYTGKLVEDLVFTVPLSIGVKKSATNYEVVWNDKDSQIEIWMTLKEDQKVKIGSDSVKLEKDERILLARSVKFNEWTFTKLMSDVGFRTEMLVTCQDRSYVLSMVQPTRYSV